MGVLKSDPTSPNDLFFFAGAMQFGLDSMLQTTNSGARSLCGILSGHNAVAERSPALWDAAHQTGAYQEENAPVTTPNLTSEVERSSPRPLITACHTDGIWAVVLSYAIGQHQRD